MVSRQGKRTSGGYRLGTFSLPISPYVFKRFTVCCLMMVRSKHFPHPCTNHLLLTSGSRQTADMLDQYPNDLELFP